jgi:hypothetical protein
MIDRREFFKELIRLTLLSGLLAGLARLAMRNGSNDKLDDSCKRNGVCRNCPLLEKCGHPTARSFKEVGE